MYRFYNVISTEVLYRAVRIPISWSQTTLYWQEPVSTVMIMELSRTTSCMPVVQLMAALSRILLWGVISWWREAFLHLPIASWKAISATVIILAPPTTTRQILICLQYLLVIQHKAQTATTEDLFSKSRPRHYYRLRLCWLWGLWQYNALCKIRYARCAFCLQTFSTSHCNKQCIECYHQHENKPVRFVQFIAQSKMVCYETDSTDTACSIHRLQFCVAIKSAGHR